MSKSANQVPLGYDPTVLGVGDAIQCFHGLAAITYLLSASDLIAIRRRVYCKAMKNYSETLVTLALVQGASMCLCACNKDKAYKRLGMSNTLSMA